MPRNLAVRIALVALLFSGVLARADERPDADALDDALALVGWQRRDLGWEARGWWNGYPDVPYKLRHVDAFFREPLAVVPYGRGLGAVVRDVADPAQLGEIRANRPHRITEAVFRLGIDPRYGAMRPYGAGLTGEPTPLDAALKRIWERAGRPTRIFTFDQAPPYPTLEKDLAEAVKPLPALVSGILGKLVLDLLDAQRWADLAWRDVPLELRSRVAHATQLGEEEVDALDYEPAVDDVARRWDEASLWYAGIKVVEALEVARLALATSTLSTSALTSYHLDVATPLGRVVVNGTGGDFLDLGDAGAWLAVDLGGGDGWVGSVGASSAERSIGAALDLSGVDEYRGRGASQGAGITGIGVLLDAAGDDRYVDDGTLAQGAGQFGLGALIDLAGDDVHKARYSAQGAAFFGVGVLLDLDGSDHYEGWSDVQGFGGAAGVGVLGDRAGDDTYVAEQDPEVTRRPSYHSDLKVAVSNAQGCAMGRRGDGADGHSWAGGLGALLDVAGDDKMLAGNWAQGCGYWFGTGLLWDGAGDDVHRANGWSSGSGAHFCVGALVDEAGDDSHETDQNWGPAFGHDFTVALLVDVAGKDFYRAGGAGIAHSINRSVALLLEGGGDDTYRFDPPKPDAKTGKPPPPGPDPRPGTAPFDARYLDRTGPTRYWTESRSIALFLDAGGTDAYPFADLGGTTWFDPPESENRRARNVAVGVDRPSGTIDLERFSARR